MFIGKTYHFLKKSLSKNFLLPFTIYLVFFQNPAVYGGIVVDNGNLTAVAVEENLDYDTGGSHDTSDGNADGNPIGGVIIIVDSAEDFNVTFDNTVMNAGGGAAIVGPADLVQFYDFDINNFDEGDTIAILNLTDNNTSIVIENVADIYGNIVLHGGNNNITTIEGTGTAVLELGSIDTGHGNDVLTFDNLTDVDGYINLRDGNNVLTMIGQSDISGDVDTGDDVDEITLEDQSWINGSLDTGGGNDIVNISGEHAYNHDDIDDRLASVIGGNVDLGTGDDTINLTGQSFINGNLNGGDDDDTILISGDFVTDYDPDTAADQNVAGAFVGGNLDAGAGDDDLTIDKDSQVVGTIDLGTGNDTAYITSSLDFITSIDLNDGDDIVLFEDTTIDDAATITGSDTDTGGTNLEVNGETFFVNGDYVLLDNSDITDVAVFALEDGTNTIHLRDGSTITDAGATFTLGAEDDNIILEDTSTITVTTLDLGLGNNTVNLSGSSQIDGALTTGAGENTFTFSGTGEKVTGLITTDDTTGNNLEFINLTGDATTNFDKFGLTHFKSLQISGGDAIGVGAGVNITLGEGTYTDIIFDLTNGASLTRNVTLDGLGSTLTFSGGSTLDGTLLFDTGTNNLNMNNSTITGTVTGVAGDDILTLTNGSSIDGAVNLGDGTNSVSLDGSTIDSLITGSGDDTLTMTSTSTITNNVNLGTGANNTVNIANSVIGGSLSTQSTANDYIDIANSTISGLVTLTGNAVKDLDFSGSIFTTGLDLDGTGTVTLDSTGDTFNGNINLAGATGATNVLNFTGSQINASIIGGTGVNTLDLVNTTVNGAITLNASGDGVTLNNSSAGSIDAAGGTDTLTLEGSGTIANAYTNFENLEVDATGTWTLNSGLTLINGGAVNINSGTVTINGVTLDTGDNATVIDAGSTVNLIAGTLDVGTAATTIDGAVSMSGASVLTSTGGVTVGANGSLLGTGTVTGNTVVNGTIGNNTVTDILAITGTLTLAANSTLDVIVDNGLANTHSQITATANVTDTDPIGVNLTFNSLQNDGFTYDILTAAGGINGADYVSNSDTFSYTVTFTDTTNTQLNANITRIAYPDLDSSVVQQLIPMLTQLETIRASNLDSPELLALELQDKAGFEAAAKQINPSIIANLSNIAIASHTNLGSFINKRMDFMQFGFQTFSLEGPMGPEHEAEDIYGNDFNLWMDTNYKTGEQDDDDLAIGYDFNTYNFTIGGDMFVADWLIGAAISYGDTDVEYNSNSGESEVSSYSIAGYAKYSQDEFFWDTTLSLSISDMDNERTVNNTDSSMDSSSDGLIYSLSSQIGYEFQAETTYFTPIAGLSYTKSQIDGVNESGSIFAVTTDDQDYDSVQSKLGFRTGLMNIMDNEDYYILEMRAFWYHEFMDTDRDLNARFNAGGDSFNVAGIENETESFLLGLGWKYEFDNTELKVDYDYEMSSGFTAHKIGVSWVLRF